MAVSVVVAVGDIGDRLVERLERESKNVKVGPATEPESEMGPVITAAARDRINGLIGEGEAAGAKLVVDGRVADGGGGFWVNPTLFDDATPEMSIYREEIFGPVLTVVRVHTLGEAIELINENRFANGTAIFTRSGYAARTFKREVEVGMIGVNVPIPVPMAFYSFGGWRESMFGDHHIHGPEGVRFYTWAKAITERWPARDDRAEQALNFPTSD
jgi:malonate-semialdehyde dehydrogenase (acetylating)/methylmalonate-semialdehyde dehydrogenase